MKRFQILLLCFVFAGFGFGRDSKKIFPVVDSRGQSIMAPAVLNSADTYSDWTIIGTTFMDSARVTQEDTSKAVYMFSSFDSILVRSVAIAKSFPSAAVPNVLNFLSRSQSGKFLWAASFVDSANQTVLANTTLDTIEKGSNYTWHSVPVQNSALNYSIIIIWLRNLDSNQASIFSFRELQTVLGTDTTMIDSIGPYQAINFQPLSPILISPIDGSGSVSANPTFLWHSSTNATSYRFELLANGGGTVLVDNPGIAETTFSVTGLASGTTYSWRVNASNIDSVSDWSVAWSFTTVASLPVPNAPNLILPVNNAANTPTNLTFVWNQSVSAVSYHLQVLTGGVTIFADIFGITDTTYLVSGLANGVAYSWRVSASNATGTSDWSGVWSFTTVAILPPPAKPNLIIPVNNAVGTSTAPFLSWSIVPNATSYDVEVAQTSSFANIVFSRNGIGTVFVSVQPALANFTTYYWRVRAVGPGGTSDWSTTWNFLTTGTNSVIEKGAALKDFALEQNYPNPFNPSTKISFNVPHSAQVRINILNLLGERVSTLVDGELDAGNYEVSFDASSLSSGEYFCRMETAGFTKVTRMILLK